jgi:uncharacterized protein
MLPTSTKRKASLADVPVQAEQTTAPPLYPDGFVQGEGYPTEADCVILPGETGKGMGVYAVRTFSRGQRICRISGSINHEVRQHTLQISAGVHLFDPYFSGYLLHSCDPNCLLDMQRFELWALRDIAPGDAITMDYVSTEDVLFKQFRCLCGSANCRGWITGRREAPHDRIAE